MRQKLILLPAAFLIIGVLSWGAHSQNTKVTKTSWEYMLVNYSNDEATSKNLNELGAQGWEVVAASDRVFDHGNQTSSQIVLKRAK
jgi:hypothetical protein